MQEPAQKPKQYMLMLQRLKERRSARLMTKGGRLATKGTNAYMQQQSNSKHIATKVISIKSAIIIAVACITLIIGIPALTIILSEADLEPIELDLDPDAFVVQLHRSKTDTIEELPLEQYIRGVIAAEMPADFQLEALKAQALAARTYFINKWSRSTGPISDDYRIDQAYLSDAELKLRWGGTYIENSNRINQAINETKGMILTYENTPIEAFFFSTSNGYTENSEDVWSSKIPYLRSVESPWDTISPKFQETKIIPISEVHDKLLLTVPVTAWSGQDTIPRMAAIKRSNGKRIVEMVIGDQKFTGREIREKLGLNSTHFTVAIKGNDMHFTTFGYGHGVGMSQWGAEAMAREGKTATEIARYFYQGIEIKPYTEVASLIPKLQQTFAVNKKTNQ